MGCARSGSWTLPLLAFALCCCLPLTAKEKDGVHYGAGLIVNVPLGEDEVAQVVADVAQNGIIRGTKEYNKDEYVSGATAVDSSKAFPAWTDGGKVFYKERKHALDPRNFKDSGDMGTLTVRYVVQEQGEKNTVLRIEAVFVEEFRHVAHPSDGSVESAEYKSIQEHLDAIENVKKQTAQIEEERRQPPAVKPLAAPPATTNDTVPAVETPPTVVSTTLTTAPAVSLEQRLHDLHHQLQRLVKAPGAPLKSSPFHTARTLQSLPTGSEVLVLILTPYWYGVETHDGQHGWILRDQLEQLP